MTENDRIGFCSEEDVTPVSMTIGDHRTHFRSIEDDEFPVVREEYEFESIPFPAAFSIGVSISDGTEISHLLSPGLGSITIVIVIDCNRLQLERNRNCNRNQIFQIVA